MSDVPDLMMTSGCTGGCAEDRAASPCCALHATCDVVAGRAVPNLSHTLALCEALLGGGGAFWLEDRPEPSWTACAPLRLVSPDVIGALRHEGIFDTQGWAPVRLAGDRTFRAAAPMRTSSGESFGLLVMEIPEQAAACFEPDVLQAMATVIAHQMSAEEESCSLRQDRHSAGLEAEAYRNLLREAKGRAANEVQKAASLMFLEAMADLPGNATRHDGG